ncbi:hypothetical protein AX16_009363 [Volvariella volvacea WC 439]|nr:hypothetical protein AX16_009363 [Volvariella volvacea WC 439]
MHGNMIDSKLSSRLGRVHSKAKHKSLLHETIVEMYARSGSRDYRSTVAFTQSSGTGKSRTVDEMASMIFAIPFNLRDDFDSQLGAYPPPDGEVRNYLFQVRETEIDQRVNYLAFLWRIFQVSPAKVKELLIQNSPTVASQWQEYLANAESRNDLYHSALSGLLLTVEQWKAEGKYSIEDTTAPENLAKEAIKALVDMIRTQGSTQALQIVMYFDEARRLPEPIPNRNKTLYDTLLWALNVLKSTNLFVIFLSTTPHIGSLAPSPHDIASVRAVFATPDLHAPITETPFDCPSQLRSLKPGSYRLQDTQDVEFMANFGRPMFWAIFRYRKETYISTIRIGVMGLARAKLIGSPNIDNLPVNKQEDAELAVVDSRLCWSYEPPRSKVVKTLSELVANHMQHVYSILQHREYIRAGYPSEPIIAAWRRKNGHITFDILAHFMNNNLIDRGECGEIMARAILVEAYDSATASDNTSLDDTPLSIRGCSVLTFIRELFNAADAEKIFNAKPDNVPQAGNTTVRQTFENSAIRVAGDGSLIKTQLALALNDFTEEHPHQSNRALPAVRNQKPTWTKDSFSWIEECGMPEAEESNDRVEVFQFAEESGEGGEMDVDHP